MIVYNDIHEYVSLRPAYYRLLKTINLSRDVSQDGCGKYEVDVVLKNISETNCSDLHVKFINAFDISIHNVESMSGIQLEIEDVSGRQLEGAEYQVKDVEEGIILFYCEEFIAEIK